MRAGVAKITPQQGKRVIEQGATHFPLGFHGYEEFIKTTHDGAFDLSNCSMRLGSRRDGRDWVFDSTPLICGMPWLC